MIQASSFQSNAAYGVGRPADPGVNAQQNLQNLEHAGAVPPGQIPPDPDAARGQWNRSRKTVWQRANRMGFPGVPAYLSSLRVGAVAGPGHAQGNSMFQSASNNPYYVPGMDPRAYLQMMLSKQVSPKRGVYY